MTDTASLCSCVRCGTCHGLGGDIDTSDPMSDWETCEDCNGSGITELCDHCQEIDDD